MHGDIPRLSPSSWRVAKMSVDTAFTFFVTFICNKRPTLQCGEVRFVTVGVCLRFVMLVPLDLCKVALLECKVM